jgi:hypothetical protein
MAPDRGGASAGIAVNRSGYGFLWRRLMPLVRGPAGWLAVRVTVTESND